GHPVHLGVLAVIDHVDANLGLLCDSLRNRAGDAPIVSGAVVALTQFFRVEQRDKIRRARQAAGVRGEDAVRAAFHGVDSGLPQWSACYRAVKPHSSTFTQHFTLSPLACTDAQDRPGHALYSRALHRPPRLAGGRNETNKGMWNDDFQNTSRLL